MGSTVFPPAASGPTLSEITSAGTSAGWGATGDSAWVHLQTITRSYDSNTTTFSSLSGYKKYKIITSRINVSGNQGGVWLRINGDTSSSYFYQGLQFYSGSWGTNAGNYNRAYVGEMVGGIFYGEFTVDFANSTAAKRCNVIVNGGGGGWYNTQVTYTGTSTVSSISILNGDTGTFEGNFYLYGAN